MDYRSPIQKRKGALATLTSLAGAMASIDEFRDLARTAVGGYPAVVQVHDGNAILIADGEVIGSVPYKSHAHGCIEDAIVEHHQAYVAGHAVRSSLDVMGFRPSAWRPTERWSSGRAGKGSSRSTTRACPRAIRTQRHASCWRSTPPGVPVTGRASALSTGAPHDARSDADADDRQETSAPPRDAPPGHRAAPPTARSDALVSRQSPHHPLPPREEALMPYKRLIAVDFDGVLHSYTSPWSDAATISDGPTPGAMQFLRVLVEDGRFDVVIVSSRLSGKDGGPAVYTWIRRQLETELGSPDAFRIYNRIRFEKTRPPAFLTIDDRAWTFSGTWPDLDTIAAFKPWNKRPAAETGQVGDRDAARLLRFAADRLVHVHGENEGLGYIRAMRAASERLSSPATSTDVSALIAEAAQAKAAQAGGSTA